MAFTHLHVHSEFSLLDGAIRIDDLLDRVVNIGQNAVAITDHGWLASAVKFQESSKKLEQKPKAIIGMETYLSTNPDLSQPAKNAGDNFHLTLLAKNRDGYKNLMRLTSLAHIDGFSYKARINHSLLSAYSPGVIVLSGCIGAEIPQTIITKGWKEGLKLAQRYQNTYRDDFYIEIQHHGATNGIEHVRALDDNGNVRMTETDLNMALVMIADKLGVGLIATNDAHYLLREHGNHHDTMLCIGMGAWKEKADRMRFPGAEQKAWEFYIKDEAEMLALSDEPFWQTACANTAILADSIERDVVPIGESILPKYKIPHDEGFEQFLKTGKL